MRNLVEYSYNTDTGRAIFVYENEDKSVNIITRQQAIRYFDLSLHPGLYNVQSIKDKATNQAA